jgi:hypothetical protein
LFHASLAVCSEPQRLVSMSDFVKIYGGIEGRLKLVCGIT